jgi:tRNA (cmo5U34)-methyltransferase
MGVAAHLGIKLADYDARIRKFIPDYEEMLDAAAAVIPARTRTIVDLGVGTGTLSLRCLKRVPRARIVGIDNDPEILKMAARRLPRRSEFIHGTFLRVPLPACEAAVASFALHHVRTRAAKVKLYRRIRASLRPRGLLVSVDCHPAAAPNLAGAQREVWKSHLLRSYQATQAEALLRSWSKEDVYVPLESEIKLLQKSGFFVEVLWRRGSFAVIMGTRQRF